MEQEEDRYGERCKEQREADEEQLGSKVRKKRRKFELLGENWGTNTEEQREQDIAQPDREQGAREQEVGLVEGAGEPPTIRVEEAEGEQQSSKMTTP